MNRLHAEGESRKKHLFLEGHLCRDDAGQLAGPRPENHHLLGSFFKSIF